MYHPKTAIPRMLFKTTEEFSAYVQVNDSLPFKDLRTHILSAENRWMPAMLGDALYAKLKDDYNAESDEPEHIALLDMCRRAVALLAFKLYSPFGQVNMSDAGFRIVQDENYRPAYRWQVASLEEACEVQGYMALEQLLAFLEQNKADYPEWEYRPPSFTLPSARLFDEQVCIDASRMVYDKLLPHIRSAERVLERTASKQEMASLRNAVLAGTLSAAQYALLDVLRPAVAHLAFSKGIKSLPVRFADGNVRVYAAQFPGGSDFAPKVQADSAMLSEMARMHAEQAQRAEAELASFLKANHADYPGYGASGIYQPDQAPPDYTQVSGKFFMA